MDSIGNMIDGYLKKRPPLAERLDTDRVLKLWPEVVGHIIASQTRASQFRDGFLRVQVASSVWCHELSFLKDEIRKKLNDRLGADVVNDIKFSEGQGL